MSCIVYHSFILVSHSSIPEFGNSEETVLLDKMVDAYSQQDEEVLKECTSDGIFRAMDPEVLNCMCKSLLVHHNNQALHNIYARCL